jgi:hypothetical protein
LFEIQGDDGVLPSIGRKTGRLAVADFIRDVSTLTKRVTVDVEDILASESRAAIIVRSEAGSRRGVSAIIFAVRRGRSRVR